MNATINTNTASIIVDGEISSEVCMQIARTVYRAALPPELSDIASKLEGLKTESYSAMLADGIIAKGRDFELGAICRPMLKGAMGRLARALGREDQDAIREDRSSASVATGAALFKGETTFDPEQDGLGFDISGYFPTKEEAVYDVECIMRVQHSLSKHEGLNYLVRRFTTDDGSVVDMMMSWDSFRKDAIKRQRQVEVAMVAAEKAGVLYSGWEGYGELTLAGLEMQCELHPTSVGVNEALENVERLMALGGYSADIGVELVNKQGKNKALSIIEALFKRDWRKAKSAMRYFGLIRQSSDAMNLISQVTDSPEWQAEQFDAQDRQLRKAEAKAKREQDRDDRLDAISRDREVREFNRMADSLRREKTRLAFEKQMAAMEKELQAELNPKPKDAPKAVAPKKSRKTK